MDPYPNFHRDLGYGMACGSVLIPVLLVVCVALGAAAEMFGGFNAMP